MRVCLDVGLGREGSGLGWLVCLFVCLFFFFFCPCVVCGLGLGFVWKNAL